MILIVSSSNRPDSRSHRLAELARDILHRQGENPGLVRLIDHPLPPFIDDPASYTNEAYQALHAATSKADSIILAGPVYNWAPCAELKKYIEFAGSTPPGGVVRGAFFDKVVTMLMAGGLPQSYMAGGSLMLGLLYDFKCILNPYTVYTSNEDWVDSSTPGEAAMERLRRALAVHSELAIKLSGRTYKSTWTI